MLYGLHLDSVTENCFWITNYFPFAQNNAYFSVHVLTPNSVRNDCLLPHQEIHIFSCILWNQSKYCVLPNSLAIYFKQICWLLLIYSISRFILWCSSIHFLLFSLFLEISHSHGLNTT